MLVFQKGKNLGIGKIEKCAPQKCPTFEAHISTMKSFLFYFDAII